MYQLSFQFLPSHQRSLSHAGMSNILEGSGDIAPMTRVPMATTPTTLPIKLEAPAVSFKEARFQDINLSLFTIPFDYSPESF